MDVKCDPINSAVVMENLQQLRLEKAAHPEGAAVTRVPDMRDPAVIGGAKQFCDIRRADNTKINPMTIKIGEGYYHCPTPVGFKANLLPHQQTALAAMLEIEDKRTIEVQRDGALGETRHVTSAGLLSEKFGSGKTVILLALLVAKPMPANHPIIQTCRYAPGGLKQMRSTYFVKKMYDPAYILKPALLFVASSVVLQWNKACADFSDLKVLCVSSVFDLRGLQKHIEKKTLNNFDLVLVKNGNITGQIDIPGYTEDKNKKTNRKIYNVIANLTRGYCWSRAIFDDYDVIKLPRPTAMLDALFTWFISATDFQTNLTRLTGYNEHTTLRDVLTYHDIDLMAIAKNMSLKSVFNVCNAPEYTEDSIAVGRPVFWAHRIVNQNKQYVQMIGALAGDKAAEIMEMLNGDAIGTAAEHAGIKSDNITDIFKKILDDQFDKYALSVATLEFIATLDIPGFCLLPDPAEDDFYHQKHVYKRRPIEFNFPGIKDKVEAVYAACVADKTTSGRAIDRVKDNIKEKDCPVCCGDLGDDDSIIVKCCGKILCANCGIQGTSLRRNGQSIEGKCPNCRAIIGFTDLIFINSEFNLDDIVKGKLEADDPDPQPKAPADNAEAPPKTKGEVLCRIIQGGYLPGKKNIAVTIPGMLVGINDLPEAPPEHRKTIIFSNFDESLKCLGEEMEDAGITYKRLGGTAAQLHAVASEFHDSYDGVNVLLINGEKYSSGRNLQSATNLVFMHKIQDPAIEAQIIGRVQRMGRKYKCHVHYVLYDDEV